MIGYDILIVGGGMAGLSAALSSDPDLSVAVVSKVHPLRSHSVAAQGGINAALGNNPDGRNDSWENHAFDTIKGSDFLADQDSVELMCELAVPTIYELEHWGVPFSRFPDAVIAQRPFGGAGFPRTCYAADRTGLVILETLFQQAIKKGVTFFNEILVTGLVVKNETCQGIVALDLSTGKIISLQAKAVIFATGGYGRVYLKTTNAFINHGSGIGIAYRAGIPLKDMEFVQFHPTSLLGKNILITEGARGEGGYLINNKGQRFMSEYAPDTMELAPRDIVARAIQTEIDKGNGFQDQYVHLDLTHLGEDKIMKRLPAIRDICINFAEIDPVYKPIPILPAQHYSMGGIDVDSSCASVVNGFFAAGECACVSVHGANRLGGNSLLETVVFGKIAGNEASRYCRSRPQSKGIAGLIKENEKKWEDKISQWGRKSSGEATHELLKDLKTVMTEKVGIFRKEKELSDALDDVARLRDRYKNVFISNTNSHFNQVLVNAIEFESMLDLVEVIILGALTRKETRGSHYRLDYRRRNDKEWLKHTLMTLKDDRPQIEFQEVKITHYKPVKRKY